MRDGLTDQGRGPALVGLVLMLIPLLGIAYGVGLRCRYPAGSRGHAYGLVVCIVGSITSALGPVVACFGWLYVTVLKTWPAPL